MVVPVRNAEGLLDDCLSSIVRSQPREIIVVDGMSTDGTLDIASRYRARIVSDGGRGLPAARLLGADLARSRWVALVDADVVLPDGALERLFAEFVDENYMALQAGLLSVSDSGYWGRALANHHRWGRNKNYFGLVATIFERDALLRTGFDEQFLSGEDIELRWRLERSGAKLGVSKRVIVTHRFQGGFAFARGQWLADGQGLARMVAKHRWGAAWLILLPLASGIRGIVLSVVRGEPKWIPYFACYTFFNYAAMLRQLVGGQRHGLQAVHPGPTPPESRP